MDIFALDIDRATGDALCISTEILLVRESSTILHCSHDVDKVYWFNFQKHRDERKVILGSSAHAGPDGVSLKDQDFWRFL